MAVTHGHICNYHSFIHYSKLSINYPSILSSLRWSKQSVVRNIRGVGVINAIPIIDIQSGLEASHVVSTQSEQVVEYFHSSMSSINDFEAELRFYDDIVADRSDDGKRLRSLPDPSNDGREVCGELRREQSFTAYEICDRSPNSMDFNNAIDDQTSKSMHTLEDDDYLYKNLKVTCCRHFAYAFVPKKFYITKGILQPKPVVVVSRRLLSLPEEEWKGIIVHELGHCIDFVVWGENYRLLNHKNVLNTIDRNVMISLECASDDPEIRADNIANNIILLPQGKRLVYDTSTLRQKLVTLNEYKSEIIENSSSGNPTYLMHYPHEPVNGDVSGLNFQNKERTAICVQKS